MQRTDGFILAALWILLTFAGTIAYSLEFFQAQGRYLFPALGAIAIFAAAGLGEWIRLAGSMVARIRVPEAWTHWLLPSVIIGGMILLDLFCLYRYLIPGLTPGG
jgi:hypothetical protein